MTFFNKVLKHLFLKYGNKFFQKYDDEKFLKIAYRARMGKRLNLKNPKTYNEKLQWLKLYDRKPEYTTMVDKYAVREYIKEKIGEEYLIPLLGVWDRFEDIDFEKLPNQFVLKCNHDSGGLVICKDKTTLDIELVEKKINNSLKKNYYFHGREWPYKEVEPKIIAEKYMVDESGDEIKDYKIMCFNGVPKVMLIVSDRQTEGEETKFDFFDMEFNHLPVTKGHPHSKKEIMKPQSFDEMKKVAEKLSAGIPHARIDFYDVNGKLYFGEITFFPASGFGAFKPEEWDYKFGSHIELSKNS